MKRLLPFILFLLFTTGLAAQQEQPAGIKSYPLFSILQDTANSDPFVFYFKDKSSGNILSWHWDFGDGSSSDKQYPKHEYAEPGIYQVCLTIETIQNGMTEEEVMCKKVRVAEKGYFNMGGHVFASQFPIEEGLAYLYKLDSLNQVKAIDTSTFDTLGYYYFYQKKDGRYIVKAEAAHDLGQYASYMPTYYGDEVKWKDADIIEFDTTMFEYDINLHRAAFTASGQGNISGTINYDSASLKNVSARNIPIYLINEASGKHLCTYSDENGIFEFDNIQYGNYRVHAEMTGLESTAIYRNVAENNSGNEPVNLLIKEEKIVAATPNSIFELENEISRIYPNPAHDQARLKISGEFKGTVNIKVYDQTGRLVFLEHAHIDDNGHIVTINTTNYSPGIYNVQITSGRGSGFLRRFLKN